MIEFVDDLYGANVNEARLISFLANLTAMPSGKLPYARWVLVTGDNDKVDGLSGNGAAAMSELVLRETFVRVIASGTTYITSIFPPRRVCCFNPGVVASGGAKSYRCLRDDNLQRRWKAAARCHDMVSRMLLALCFPVF